MTTTLQELATRRNEIVDSGLLFHLAKDLVTREIDTTLPFMHLTDELELGDYHTAIQNRYGNMSPDFLGSVVETAVARFKATKRQSRDYWGRPTTDPSWWV